MIETPVNRTYMRRGNTMVLVAGILVLLVIIAAAYVSRTQAGRTTAVAQRTVQKRSDIADVVADDIAQLIADALFVEPVDPNTGSFTAAQVIDSNSPRRSAQWVPHRGGVDPNFWYNRAPDIVVPWTNHPDPDPGNLQHVLNSPFGAGNLDRMAAGLIAGEALAGVDNPIGNPGTGDTRWLADLEPVRILIDPDGNPESGDEYYRFSHWRHMTNISKASNAWRVIGDMSNVTGSTIIDLNVPVEQWLSTPPPEVQNALTVGRFDAWFDSNSPARWDDWLGLDLGAGETPLDSHLTAYASLLGPGNFFRLKNPNGNNQAHEDFNSGEGERRQDAHTPGTVRWNVERRLADADGDGYTDAFWFLSPTVTENGIRHAVAVRIVDNGGQLNVNTASRFERGDINAFGNSIAFSRTAGHTPADVAQVGQNVVTGEYPWEIPAGYQYFGTDPSWAVGYFDTLRNSFDQPHRGYAYPVGLLVRSVVWNPASWSQLDDNVLGDLGVLDNFGIYPNELTTQAERHALWRNMGRRPFDPFLGHYPFSIEDELELRAYHGQNMPWSESRLENAYGENFLRASNGDEESSEYREQLIQYELMHDHRRRITTYNSTRNDFKPRYLWLYPPDTDITGPAGDPDGVYDQLDIDLFLEGARKIDLRALVLRPDLVRDNIANALTYENGNFFQTYFGDDGASANRCDEIAASLTANILAYRDPDTILNNYTEVEDPNSANVRRFLGMEPQPFLVEAFIGHYVKGYEVPDFDNGDPPDPWLNSGERVLLDSQQLTGTVVCIQLANPFDVEIDLSLYTLDVFGSTYQLSHFLPPATEEKVLGQPRRSFPTAIVFAARDEIDGDTGLASRWRDFLDVDVADGDLPPGSVLFDASGSFDTNTRDAYDDGQGDGIQLLYNGIVIDRFDPHAQADRRFQLAVEDMGDPANRPQMIQGDPDDQDSIPPDPNRMTYPPSPPNSGQRITLDPDDNYWVQWVRVTRAWGVDVDGDGIYEDEERSPRYMYGDYAVVTSQSDATVHSGYGFNKDDDPDGPWFDRSYEAMSGVALTRKPTFFDFGLNDQNPNPPLIVGYPNKGWYTQAQTDVDGLEGVDDPVRQPGGGIGTGPLTLSRIEPIQPLIKNRNFEQVGELLNVWLYGHELQYNLSGQYLQTLATFSERMSDPTYVEFVGSGGRANRLATAPQDLDGDLDNGPELGRVIGYFTPQEYSDVLNGVTPRQDFVLDPRHGMQALPAGVRVLASFVCDGPGLNGTVGTTDFFLAQNYTGQGTPGLVNINTATVEVLRALPHWDRLVLSEHDSSLWDPSFNPYVWVADALVSYRDRLGAHVPYLQNGPIYDPMTGFGPGYADRGRHFWGDPNGNQLGYIPGMRGGRGFAVPSELVLLRRGGKRGKAEVTNADVTPNQRDLEYHSANDQFAVFNTGYNSTFSIEYAGLPERHEFLAERDYDIQSVYTQDVANSSLFSKWHDDAPNDDDFLRKTADLSTDVNSTRDATDDRLLEDSVAMDQEERNLLYAGASNMITTRSDVFTVYFKIRSFKQNRSTGVWDATDAEHIVDERRYVMMVDRTEVNHPNDKPKIIYMERLPN